MELYVHRPSNERVILIEVEPDATLSANLDLNDGEQVWLEDSVEAIDISLTFREAGINHRNHVHINRHAVVAVEVAYQADVKKRQFQSSTRIKRVFEWATGPRGYDLTPTDQTEHVLQLSDSTVQPDNADHLGSFASGQHPRVCFDLVPKHRNEG